MTIISLKFQCTSHLCITCESCDCQYDMTILLGTVVTIILLLMPFYFQSLELTRELMLRKKALEYRFRAFTGD